MFKVLKTTKFDGYEFELLEHTESKHECIRMRYNNAAGQPLEVCPTVWVQDIPAFIQASFNLLSETNEEKLYNEALDS